MKNILKIIKKSKRVGIIAHISPDPDCMSSMTALSCLLESMGKQTHMFVDCNKFRDNMSYYNLPDNINEDLNLDDFDTLIAVDLPQLSLMGKYGEAFTKHNNTIVIDHHESRNLEAKEIFVDFSRSSCSEIIFDLAKQLNLEITPRIASIIYAGILGDTNCFENDNINEQTFLTASGCVACGADIQNVTFIFQKHQTLAELKLKEYGYKNMVMKNKIAYCIFTKKMFKHSGVDDCPTFVNEILNTEDNVFAYVIKQKDKNTYTVSFRCKNGYNVANIAKKFGGGGHVQASGTMFVGSPTKYAKLIYDECLKQLEGNNV